MQRRRLGNSDLEVTPVILGTWALGGWLWGGLSKNRPGEAIAASLDAGINTIDTAPVYGFGLSEELVGRAVAGRRDVVIATKCGLVWVIFCWTGSGGQVAALATLSCSFLRAARAGDGG